MKDNVSDKFKEAVAGMPAQYMMLTEAALYLIDNFDISPENSIRIILNMVIDGKVLNESNLRKEIPMSS